MEKTLNTNSQSRWNRVQPWIICLSAALFFFYQFTQMNSLNALSSSFIQTFNLSNVQLGNLSAAYLLGLALFFIPTGLLLDRFSTRRMMLLAMGISIFSTVLLSQAQSETIAVIARFLLGMAHGIAFLSCIRLAGLWLPNRLALAVGLIITIGLSGGVVAQTPLTFLIKDFGWRNAILFSAGLGMVIWIILFLFIQDSPRNQINKVKENKQQNFFSNIKQVILNPQNWICSLYTCLLNLPIILLGALWGNLYLTHEDHLSVFQSSTIAAMLYVGTMVGSPIIGWLSDRFNQRKLFMILGALLALFSILVIGLISYLSFQILLGLFFIIGIVTSTQTLSYPIIVENNSKEYTSSAMGFASVLIMGGGAVFQPLFGWLIQQNWKELYSFHVLDNFRVAFLLLPAAFIVSLFLSFFIKENKLSNSR